MNWVDSFLRKHFFRTWRRKHPELWDYSGVVFSKDFTKETFLSHYPLYPGGRYYTGYSVIFETESCLKVLGITAITNSGIRSIAMNRRKLILSLEGICPVIKESYRENKDRK